MDRCEKSKGENGLWAWDEQIREWIIGMGRTMERMDRYEKSKGENG